MDILVVKMSALGDVIQALPVIPALREGFPGCRIHWLVEEAAHEVVRCHPGVDEVMVSRRSTWPRQLSRPKNWPRAMSELRALVAELRRPYDIAIDLQGLVKSGIWMGLTRARRKIGFRQARERINRLFLTEAVGGISGELHAVDRYLQLVASLGCPRVREPDFGLRPPQEATRRIKGLLASAGYSGDEPMAVLAPAARWESKRWTEAGFARLGDLMAESLGLQVVLVGGWADRPLLNRISEKMRRRALNLVGKTDIPALMALMGMARVVVSTDSGPMHMAAALGTPVVALFGPTAPWRTGPYGSRHRVVRAAVSCSPCFRRRCPERSCMERIEPEEVLVEVVRVVDGVSPKAPRQRVPAPEAVEARP